jgi:RNA polymerase sigma-70 factor, ECF subfamily
MPLLSRDPLADPESLIRRVYAYVAYRVGDGAEAEDITSETFERALRYRSSFDGARGQPIGWLIGIARNCISDASADHRPEAGESLVATDSDDVEHETIERLTLVAALERLQQRDREMIALRYGADLTAREIGNLLGTSTNVVEVALHRALRRLRRMLDQDAGPPAAAPRL